MGIELTDKLGLQAPSDDGLYDADLVREAIQHNAEGLDDAVLVVGEVAAAKGLHTTDPGVWALHDLTEFAQLILAAADALTARGVLGAASRDLLEINPREDTYGAAGDGIVDDTAELQAALDAIGDAGGGSIYLPRGTYKHDDLLFPRVPVILRGDGQGATVLDYVGTGVGLTIGNGVDYNDWGSIRDLSVTSAVDDAITLVRIENAHRGTIRNCNILGTGDPVGSRGLHMIEAFSTYLMECVVASLRTAIDLDGICHDTSLKDVSAAAYGTCIKILNSHNVRISGGQISDSVSDCGIRVDGTDADNLSYGFELRDVHFEGNAKDFIIGDAAVSTSYVPSPTIVGCPVGHNSTLDKADRPTLVGLHLGSYAAATVLTLTANCIEAVLLNVYETAANQIVDNGVRTVRIDHGELRLSNNQSLKSRDSGGTYRRGLGLSAGNAWNFGDLDGAGHAAQVIGTNVNLVGAGVEQARADSLGLRIQSGGRVKSGAGTPEGAVTGNVGDLFLRTDGALGTIVYYKATGGGTNTGWQPQGIYPNNTGPKVLDSGGTARRGMNLSASNAWGFGDMDGAGHPAQLVGGSSAELVANGVVQVRVDSTDGMVLRGGARISSGYGAPAGGTLGDIWLRLDGAGGTTLYVHEAAGWVGK